MITKDNISVNHQITTLQNQVKQYKEDKKKYIQAKYQEKKANYKKQLITENIFSILATISGLAGVDAQYRGIKGKITTSDKLMLFAGILGFLLNLGYPYKIRKLNEEMQKELNEVV